MKRLYVTPEIKISAFDAEDIITASTQSGMIIDTGSVNVDGNSEVEIDVSGS